MRGPRLNALQRLATWLCCLAALVLGLVPSGAVVLCFGPEGLAVEVGLAGERCGGCPELAAACEDGGAGERVEACPCVDVTVVSPPGEAKAKPRSMGTPLAALPAPACTWPDPGAAVSRALLSRQAPRIAPRLTLIKSVVLLV
jgi:hypothetical protein